MKAEIFWVAEDPEVRKVAKLDTEKLHLIAGPFLDWQDAADAKTSVNTPAIVVKQTMDMEEW